MMGSEQVATPSPTPDPQVADAQVEALLDSARHMLDEEFRIAERIDAKARNLLTAAGTWFAVVQGIATAVLTRTHADFHKDIMRALLGVAILAGVALLVTLILTAAAWRLDCEKALPFAKLRDEYLPHAAEGNAAVSRNLAKMYFDVVGKRRESNTSRADRLGSASTAFCVASVVCACELVLAVVASSTF